VVCVVGMLTLVLNVQWGWLARIIARIASMPIFGWSLAMRLIMGCNSEGVGLMLGIVGGREV